MSANVNTGISAPLEPIPNSPAISSLQLFRQSAAGMGLPSHHAGSDSSLGARSGVSGVGVPETWQPLHHVNPPEGNEDGADRISVVSSTSAFSHLLPEIPDPR